MTAEQLAELQGLLAAEARERKRSGDGRTKAEIETGVLAEIGMPKIGHQLDRLRRRRAAAERRREAS